MALDIQSENDTELDLLTLGECMVRFNPPGRERIEYSPYFEAYVGGGEYNVAYALSRFGMRADWTAKLVDNPLGRHIQHHANGVGLPLEEVVWAKYDGVGIENRIGLHFTEVGKGIRPSVSIYDRGHNATAHLQPGEIDWNRIFGERGVRWFHLGGIFTALSDSCIDVAREAMKAAHENGTIVSYDLNFRSKLWSSEKAIDVTTDLVQYMDVVIGNEEDFQKVLGFEVEGVDESYQELQTENYKKMVNRVVDTYPNIKAVATTLREVISADENNWSALLYHEGDFYHSVKFDRLQIEDRVGGGDGFCSGLVYALLNDYEPQDAVDFGAAHGALVQTTRGDNSKADLEEVKEAAEGGSARIKR